MVTELASLRKLYPFESHFFKMKGLNYHYVDEGKGETIVMIHGNPSWSFMYRELIKSLSKKYRVIAPDHLGFGLSDKPETFPYRLETHIDNLEAFLLSLNVKNITLMVHDWGGPIGLGFAIKHPQLIKRLIITNTAAFAMNVIPWRIAAGKIPWLGRKLIVNMNLFAKAAVKMTVEKPLSKEVKQGYLFPFQKKSHRIAISRFVEDIPMDPEHPSFEVLLGIEHSLWMFKEKPVAIIWGMKDWCFSPTFYEKWVDLFPQAQLLPLKHAGHWLFEDAKDDIIPFIEHFMTD
jgi:haloalkane dehalogenase